MIQFLKDVATGLALIAALLGVIAVVIVGIVAALINYPWVVLAVLVLLLSWGAGIDYRKRKSMLL